MKIATWNVERLKHYADMDKMMSEIEKVSADILVLTETDERLKPDYPYCYHTPLLKEIRSDFYKDTENRVSVYSKYKCVNEYPTYDKYTAICVELETEYGNLCVYGTIMGIFGNREKSFKPDLDRQMEDIKRLHSEGHRVCVIGDYNLSFSDTYYYTKYGRERVLDTFEESHVFLMTSHRKECIDHIALHDDFLYYGDREDQSVDDYNSNCLRVVSVDEWNLDKGLSDHKGIVIDIQHNTEKSYDVDQGIYFDGMGLKRYDIGDVCYRSPEGWFYRVEHVCSFYVMECAENESLAEKRLFDDTDTFPDYLPIDEQVFWVHNWLKKYVFY